MNPRELIRGTPEAREYMARLRAMRGKGRALSAPHGRRGGNPPMLVIGNPVSPTGNPRGRKRKLSPDDPFWLFEGQKKIGPWARRAIENHVDRLHVSVPESEVEREIREIGARSGAPEWYIEEAVKIALNQHRENRALYAYVMGGGTPRNPVSGPVDPDAVRELILYIENTRELVGAPNSQGMAIRANLARKWYAGTYDREKAVNLWAYLVESGARRYLAEFGTPGAPINTVFNKNTRLEVARYFRDDFERRMQGGEFDPAWVRSVVPRKYHGKLPNPPMGNPPSLMGNPRGAKRDPIEAKAEQRGVRIVYLPVNQAWLVVWGTEGHRLAGPFPRRWEAVEYVKDLMRGVNPTVTIPGGIGGEPPRRQFHAEGSVIVRSKGERRGVPVAVEGWKYGRPLGTMVGTHAIAYDLRPPYPPPGYYRGHGIWGGPGDPKARAQVRGENPIPPKGNPISREEILRDYTVDSLGRITSPGKFEGQMLYVPYFFGMFLDGLVDYDRGNVVGFRVTHEDRSMFPELGKRQRTVWLWIRDDGFVQEIDSPNPGASARGVRSPWAVCTAAVGRGDRAKFERCVRAVKRRMMNPALPPAIANDPGFKLALKMYRRIHGGGPVEVRKVSVPPGVRYPKYLVAYGRAPAAFYDAPRHSRRGKRVHHFGEGGGTQPWLVTAPGKRKFLAYVGGSFRAGNWIYK